MSVEKLVYPVTHRFVVKERNGSKVLYPITHKFILKQIIVEDLPFDPNDFEGNIREYFNCSPWGYFADDASFMVIKGNAGDVVDISITYAHTGLQPYTQYTQELDGTVTSEAAQEYLAITIEPSMWWRQPDGSFEAPCYGLGRVMKYTFIPWNQEHIVWGRTLYGLTATASMPYYQDNWHSGYLVDWGNYIYTPQLDTISLNENMGDAPYSIKRLTYSFQVSGTGSFDEIMAWEQAHYEPPPDSNDFMLGVDVRAGANIILPYDYSNKTKDTVLWIYDVSVNYNGAPIDRVDQPEPFVWGGWLNIKPEGTATDYPFAVGANQRGSRIISNKYKNAPWERYPAL